MGLNTTAVHTDPKMWPEPYEFRPERFLDENNNIINSDKVFAFGAGEHIFIYLYLLHYM